MSKTITYSDAGVNIDAGNELVGKIKQIASLTTRAGVLGSIGGFAGCFDISSYPYRQPILVATTDGVGTKLRLAIEMQHHNTIGIDLVAMCVNDLVVMGAEPLFFLDYFATGKLDVAVAQNVITGIAKGCQIANTALIGGETAEMPGMYAAKDYDLAGFCVGIAEKEDIIDGRHIVEQDILIALASSGPHSNGYSLIRHLLQINQIPLSTTLDGKPLAEILLAPTRIYVKSLLSLARAKWLKGAAHITGGGFIDNIPRILPENLAAYLDCNSWQLPRIFTWLQEQGQLAKRELRRTFNCGVGMILCVGADHTDDALALLREQGETAWVIGQVKPRKTLAVEFSDDA